MLARIRKAQEKEGGFTLIELLVVIIIIGILAAIAIPVFLNQRKKGYDAQVKSDLHNLATLEESYLNDNNTYGNLASLTDYKATKGVGVNITFNAGVAYCMAGKDTNSGNVWFWDSGRGGLQPLATSYTCSDATAGTPSLTTFTYAS